MKSESSFDLESGGDSKKRANVRCLLCASGRIRIADELTGQEIIALWRVMGRSFSSQALAPVCDSTRILLYRCQACGFRFYDKSLAGSGKFYEELMAGDYYTETRPEFDFTLKFAHSRKLESVLDIGGGEGNFLDLAKRQGLRTFGLELNVAAAERAAAKGHRMIHKPLEDVGTDEVDDGVDLLTLNQVIEHVPDPMGFVRAAARLVKAGGFIAISVPNEYRIAGLIPYDPANWPPHHVSRWRKKDLRSLATRAGLKVVREGSDILYGSALESFVPLHNRLATAIQRSRHVVDVRGSRVLSFLYRKLGGKHYFPHLGLSIYIIVQK